LKIVDIDDYELRQYLLSHGFATSALSSYYQSKNKKTGLTLGFANTTSEQRQQITALIAQFLAL